MRHLRLFTAPSALAMLSLAVALVVPRALRAQTISRPSVAQLNVVELRALTDSLAAIAARQAGRQVPGRPLHRDSMTAVFLIRRDTSSRPEMHERVAEVFVLQAGRAVVISGGRVVGAGLMEPGEWNGGQIVPDTAANAGGLSGAVVRRAAGPGDVVVIPAGVPHQVEVGRGESVTYLVIKVLAVAPRPP